MCGELVMSCSISKYSTHSHIELKTHWAGQRVKDVGAVVSGWIGGRLTV